MKKSYYKNLFLYQLDTKSPVDVLKSSLSKIKDIDLLNELVGRLHLEDLGEFLDTLSASSYDLDKSNVNTILYRFTLSNAIYKKFMSLNISNFDECPTNGLLNFCLYINKKYRNSCKTTLEFYAGELDIRGTQSSQSSSCSPYFLPDFGKDDSFATQEYYKILKKLYFLNAREISSDIKNRSRDPLLKAIADKNGRVNGQDYAIKDLLLVDLGQIYGLDDEKRAMLTLCISNSESRVCLCCGNWTAENTAKYDTPDFKKQVNALLDGFIIEGSTEKICTVIAHCKFLRLAKYFRFLLKILISDDLKNSTPSHKIASPNRSHSNVRYGACRPSTRSADLSKPNLVENAYYKGHNRCTGSSRICFDYCFDHERDGACKLDRVARTIGLFAMDDEVETLTISFLKASGSYFHRALLAIPFLARTKKTCFASFVVLLQAYSKSNSSYLRTVIRSLILRLNGQFSSIVDLISVFLQKSSAIHTGELCDKESLHDKEFLCDMFDTTAELFSVSPEQFVQRFFYTIFNSLYPHPRFTESFVGRNIKYLVIQKILENKYQEQVNDVDILVGILFQNHFKGLDSLFKPTVYWFVRKNLSHILFKIKNAYVLGLYHRRCCMYKILKFLLTEVNTSLYFNYVWPYVEFFLNKENCICSGYFVEWLRQGYDSKLMSPYLPIPFEKVEDIPVLANVENKIYPMLARFFSQSKNIKYDPCPFMSSPSLSAFGELQAANCLASSAPSNTRAKDRIHNYPTHDCTSSSISEQLEHPNGEGFRQEVSSLHNKFRESIPLYSPRPIIPDHDFLGKFIYHIKSNRLFKNKILRLYPNLPIEARALFGSLKYDSKVDLVPRAPRNIPKTILEKFLLKIDYERQDLFAFTIQEFLKAIDEPFDPEVESFIEQFRHTKLDYKFKIKSAGSLNLESYRHFLESLFYILYANARGLEYFKYLVLFDDNVLEYACLCLIKIFKDPPYLEANLINDKVLLGSVSTSNRSILTFLLKINTFVGSEVIPNSDILQYALKAKDFYSVIYCLESEETNLDILQMSYYMVNDSVRVKGFGNAAGNTANSYNSMNLFFDFLLDKNYKAARECLKEIEKGHLDLIKDYSCVDALLRHGAPVENSMNDAASRAMGSGKIRAYRATDDSILKILKDIIETNTEEEIDNFIVSEEFTRSNPILLHVLKDLELLKDSDDVQRTIDLINERRAISDNPDAILKIHKLLATRINLKPFSKAIDLEIVKLLRKKKEFQKCEEEIARMVLKREFGALYEHALVKIDQKHTSEAKELLKRLAHISKDNCMRNHQQHDYLEYFKATVKLCEVSRISTLFENSITELEETFFEIFLGQEEVDQEQSSITGQHNIQDGETGQRLGGGSSLQKSSMSSLEKLKKMYEKIKQIDNPSLQTSRTQSSCLEAYHYLQKLYFLTAKHFEKTNLILSIRYYFKSFTSNHEAIPRFFHHIADVPKVHQKQVGEMVEIVLKEHLSDLIPFYNQISTKLSSSSSTSANFYSSVIKTMLEEYPYQTFWNTLILANSKRLEVKTKAVELIESLSFENRLMFKNVLKCSERLTNIAKNPSKKLCMKDFPEIKDMLPSKVNIPGQMTEINSVKDEIIVFQSLQTPKKIILVGEDGKEYHMIVKYKDDLRKDSRFMDLDDLLNKLFDEGYYIRKYNVIPFTHESGIIEYVPDLCNLKDIVYKYYDNINESIYKYTRYKKIGGNNMSSLISQFKPIYNKYLKSTYNDPYQFYTVRENYIKTYAIMNIVGWFMGLGDRHTENIHFDKNTGDTVHVDLNCIFDKAQSLEVPEKVPFRLTQNIIDGFGKLGVEGTYKHTMKYTLGLLKDNRDVIQANLLSFVFDPLSEWARGKTEPSKILDVMNSKLDYEDEDEKIEELIDEATDINNLGSMYVGWMSFL